MKRLTLAASLLAAGFGSAGCSYDLYNSHGGPITQVSNPTLTSVNQPVVSRTDYTLDVRAGGGVDEAELARLDAWFQSLDLRYGDRVALEGADYAGQSRDDIAALAASYGILLADVAPITAGAPQPGDVRVVVSRSIASVPGCPIWEDPQIGQSTRTSTNYGCATNSNLARMIADPNDLVLGQAGSIDRNGNAAAKPVKAYRDRTVTTK